VSVRPIHVLIAGLRGLLRDILADAVLSQADMRLVPETLPAGGPLSVAQRTDAEVVVFVAAPAEASAVDVTLRAAFPSRAVVAVFADGRKVLLYNYVLRRTAGQEAQLSSYDQPTPQGVVEAIRRAVRDWPLPR
jgi:hypothetical protein